MTSYKKNKDAAKLGEKLYRDSKKVRYFAEMLMFYIPLLIFWLIMVLGNDLFKNLDQNGFVFNCILFATPMILPILVEFLIRTRRRQEGFNINDNIQELVQQREVDIKVAREHKAIEKIVASEDVKDDNKNDIEYWFGLKEKGISTEDEFNKKKGELL